MIMKRLLLRTVILLTAGTCVLVGAYSGDGGTQDRPRTSAVGISSLLSDFDPMNAAVFRFFL
jgi:hypothetical protein